MSNFHIQSFIVSSICMLVGLLFGWISLDAYHFSLRKGISVSIFLMAFGWGLTMFIMLIFDCIVFGL